MLIFSITTCFSTLQSPTVMANLSLHQHVLNRLGCLIFYWAIVSADCFLPNHTQRLGPNGDADYYKPCPSTSQYGICCALYDHCRPDGLCTSSDGGLLWRESCTDQTWKSPDCINLCVSGIGKLRESLINESSLEAKVTDRKSHSHGRHWGPIQCI